VTQIELFSTASAMPEGFVYQREFISTAEEEELASAIGQLPFSEIKMHGVVAKRRTIQFGRHYGFDTFKLTEAPPMPEFLLPLRDRVAEFSHRDAASLEEVLVTEYTPGAQIGWHRDAPAFDIVAGVSLLGECTMRFRPWPSPTVAGQKQPKPLAHVLAPRSVYILQGSARSAWQHHIPATKALRYSVTFRTLRKRIR
jgi:alkylated DNA repair dioxygenase AlkB